MIILSTPHDELRKELLTKDKGYKLTNVLEKAREHEAILASKGMLQNLGAEAQDESISRVDIIRKQPFKKKCMSCGLNHAPRACPAYKDKCHNCGHIGHWQKCCRKKKHEQNQERRQN